MSNVDVSVILVNYNTKQLTADAINSVFEKTLGITYEIIVVDNASADGSVEFLKQKFADKISVIESKENLGFGGGNNLAIKAALGEYVYLLNTDALLLNNSIKILVDFIKQKEKCAGASGMVYNYENKISRSIDFIQKNNYSFMYNFFYFVKRYFCYYSKKPVKIEFPSFCAVLFKKAVLEKIGYFDEDFHMYSEDADLSLRILRAGFEFWTVPDSKVKHLDGGSYKKSALSDPDVRLRRLILSDFLFYKKAYGNGAVEKHYKERLKFYKVLNILSLGILNKKFSKRKQIMIDEYKKIK